MPVATPRERYAIPRALRGRGNNASAIAARASAALTNLFSPTGPSKGRATIVLLGAKRASGVVNERWLTKCQVLANADPTDGWRISAVGTGDNRWGFSVSRATTNLTANAPSGWERAGRWYWRAVAADLNDPTTPATLYGAAFGDTLARIAGQTLTAGSGAVADDSASVVRAFQCSTGQGALVTTQALQGDLALVAVFPRRLSLADLQAFVDAPDPAKGALLLWRCGEGRSGLIVDESGHGNTGRASTSANFPPTKGPGTRQAWRTPRGRHFFLAASLSPTGAPAAFAGAAVELALEMPQTAAQANPPLQAVGTFALAGLRTAGVAMIGPPPALSATGSFTLGALQAAGTASVGVVPPLTGVGTFALGALQTAGAGTVVPLPAPLTAAGSFVLGAVQTAGAATVGAVPYDLPVAIGGLGDRLTDLEASVGQLVALQETRFDAMGEDVAAIRDGLNDLIEAAYSGEEFTAELDKPWSAPVPGLLIAPPLTGMSPREAMLWVYAAMRNPTSEPDDGTLVILAADGVTPLSILRTSKHPTTGAISSAFD